MAEAIPDQKYTGNYIRPALTIYDNGKLLVEGKDYQVVNGNNLRAGESWVVIKGLGNYDETSAFTSILWQALRMQLLTVFRNSFIPEARYVRLSMWHVVAIP